MKRLAIFLICFTAMAFASCSSLSSTVGESVAQVSGQACGTAVLGLYNSYHNNGKVDLTNTTDLSNALALATCYTQLKENKDNESFRKAFANGLILSSAGLITSANATSFMNTLLGTSALSNINTEKVTQTAATAAAVITLLNSLKQ